MKAPGQVDPALQRLQAIGKGESKQRTLTKLVNADEQQKGRRNTK